MAVDFSKLLSKPLDDVKKPPALPAGTYYGFIKKYEFGDNNTNKTPYARFEIHLTEPGEGFDPADLELIRATDITKKAYRKDFFLTDEADWRLKAFIDSCGVQTAGRTFAETVPELLNMQVQCEMILQNSQKNEKEQVNFLGDVAGRAA